MLVTDVRDKGQAVQEDCLYLEDGTDSLSQNVSHSLPINIA